ncbi:MAG: PKD domain-containing protein [Bacteroidetes bacterium]|nr:PKD domain-containing protein [Bacteroidota bacterium]
MKRYFPILIICWLLQGPASAQVDSSDGFWIPSNDVFLSGGSVSVQNLLAHKDTLFTTGIFTMIVSKNDTIPAMMFAYYTNGSWFTFTPTKPAAVGSEMLYYNGKLYLAGGDFDLIGNNAGVIYYDSGWQVPGNPYPRGNYISCGLEVYHDTLFYGGNYTEQQPNFGRNIAAWDDSTWINMGQLRYAAAIDYVEDLEVVDFGYGEKLIACGRFGIAGWWPDSNYVTGFNHLAQWDGKQWSKFGDVLGQDVRVLYFDSISMNLFVGGVFGLIDSVELRNIGRWDGENWFPLDSGLMWEAHDNGMIVYHGELYVGGNIIEAGGDSMRWITRWDGKQWKEVGGGLDSWATSFAILEDTLYVGGYFQTIGPDSDTSIALAKWYTSPCAYLKAEIDTLWQDSNVVSLRDTSAGLWRTKWQWDFGDGQIDTVQHPLYTYQDPGTYTIQMIVSHEQCADTAFFEIFVPGDTTDTTSIATSITIQTPTLTIIPNPSHDTWRIKIQLLKRKKAPSRFIILLGRS